jgi:hypothetical protein
MSLIKLSLDGNNLLFLPRESLISDILAGDGKIVSLFYSAKGHKNSSSSFVVNGGGKASRRWSLFT